MPPIISPMTHGKQNSPSASIKARISSTPINTSSAYFPSCHAYVSPNSILTENLKNLKKIAKQFDKS